MKYEFIIIDLTLLVNWMDPDHHSILWYSDSSHPDDTYTLWDCSAAVCPWEWSASCYGSCLYTWRWPRHHSSGHAPHHIQWYQHLQHNSPLNFSLLSHCNIIKHRKPLEKCRCKKTVSFRISRFSNHRKQTQTNFYTKLWDSIYLKPTHLTEKES